jgi:hypothetical protein
MARALLAAALLTLVAACGEDTGAGSPAPPTETIVTNPADHRVAAAIADLATREGVDPAEVTVVESKDVTWSDGSLGCPQPGMSYIQAITEGHLAVLEVNGQVFEYHGGTQGPLSLCENPQPPVATQ